MKNSILKFALIVATLLCGTAFATVNLRFGFLTDTHIDETGTNLERMRSAFTLFKTNNVDLVVHGGDFANAHYPAAYTAISNLFDEVFGATKPRFIGVAGNHDTQMNLGSLSQLQATVATLALTGVENAHTDVRTVNGYTFLTMPYAIGNTTEGFLSWADYETAVSNACEAAGAGKPVFVLEHEPPQDTVYNSHNWGYAQSKEILARYPQVVELSGHVHGSLHNDLFLWQGAFTVLNACCLQVWNGLLNGVSASAGGKNSYGVLLVDVEDTRIVAYRYDVTTGAEIEPDHRWVIPLPFDAATAPYNREALTAAEVAPAFAADDVLTVTPGATCRTFTLAFPEVATNAMTYWITVQSWNGSVWTNLLETEIFSEFWKQSAAKTGRASVTLTEDGFEPLVEYRFLVQPVGQYGTKGAALVTTATAAKAGDTPDGFVPYVRATGKQYFDTGVIGRSGTKMALDVSFDEMGGDVAVLDCRKDESNSRFFLFHTSAGFAAFGYGGYARQDHCPLEKSRRYHVESELRAGLQTLDIDGARIATATSSEEIDTGANLYLFGCNFVSRGNPVQYPIKARVYGLKIWQTDTNGVYQLVRDFAPCMAAGGKDSDNCDRRTRVGALYDRVTGRLFFARSKDTRAASAAGSDVCAYLPDVFNTTSPGRPDYFVEYIRSTGSQILDTGVPGRAGLKAEGDFYYTSNASGAEQVALGHSGSAHYTVIDRVWSGAAWGGFGTYNVTTRYLTNETTQTAASWNLTTRYRVTANFCKSGAGDSTITQNGVVIYREPGVDLAQNGNLMVFATKRNIFPSYTANVRCYGLKLWLDGALVRDFRPCVKDGKPGLYDEVRGEVVFPLGDMAVTTVGKTVNEDGSPLEIPWVQTTGSQYVDLGVIGKSGTKVEMEFLLPNANDGGDHAIIGARASGSTDTRFYPIHTHQNCSRLGYVYFKYPTTPLSAQEKHHVLSELRVSSQVVTVDGTEVYRGTDATVLNTERNLYLGAINVGGTAGYIWPVRVYSLKIWQTDTTAASDTDYKLVRDFVPANGEGTGSYAGALYDRVSGTFYTPKDTNTTNNDNRFRFLPSGAVTVDGPPDALVEYIESDASQVIDTEVEVGTGLAVEGEVMWTGYFGEEQTHLGATWWPNRLYPVHNVRGDVWFGYTKDFGLYATNALGERHTWKTNVRQRYAVDFSDAAHLTATIDGVTVLDEDAGSCAFSDGGRGTLTVFAANSWNLPDYFSKSRCYAMTISRDGTPVRAFLPCVKDGRGGLYDTVGGKIYLPSLGAFTGGLIGPITNASSLAANRYVEYAESDGNAWIDTGVAARSGTRALVEYMPLEKPDADEVWTSVEAGVLGAWADARFFLAHDLGAVLASGYGPLTVTAGALTTGVTHRVMSDLRVGSQQVTLDGTALLAATDARAVDTGLSLYLGALNERGVAVKGGAMRIHRVKIWQTATTNASDTAYALVRDYKPAITAGGVIGLKDTVTGGFTVPENPFVACGAPLQTGLLFIVR